MKNVKVRFPPSPTGYLHIGSLRTALFNWLWARKNNGQFILRIEDTDQERYVEGAVENIKETLDWYGLDIDEGPIFQSERLEIYKQHVEMLISAGKAYYCFCTAARLEEVRKIQKANKQATKYDGLCRSLSKDEVISKINNGKPYVVRLKIPSAGQTEFDDMIYGKIKVENKNIDDQVLMKSDGFPTYHLANVVDDYKMGITHVIRAEEWLPSTPKHIILYQAFDWPLPMFAHLPMVLGSDRAKLSKRHGAVAALEYKKEGYLPEAILNFIALLGWNPKTEKELFSIEELIKEFDLTKVNKSSAIFNIEKLNWLNSHYIRNIDLDELVELSKPFLVNIPIDDRIKPAINLARERVRSLHEINEAIQFIYQEDLEYNPEILISKKDNLEDTTNSLSGSLKLLKSIDKSNFDSENLKNIFVKYIKDEKLNTRVVLWPLRVSVTGLENSPDVFDVMQVIGKEIVIKRVQKALENLQ
ncbi:MAG: glutamate--tRNA ligase [bacterium]|nr:glutamate--tRNA ligase [bacterium]